MCAVEIQVATSKRGGEMLPFLKILQLYSFCPRKWLRWWISGILTVSLPPPTARQLNSCEETSTHCAWNASWVAGLPLCLWCQTCIFDSYLGTKQMIIAFSVAKTTLEKALAKLNVQLWCCMFALSNLCVLAGYGLFIIWLLLTPSPRVRYWRWFDPPRVPGVSATRLCSKLCFLVWARTGWGLPGGWKFLHIVRKFLLHLTRWEMPQLQNEWTQFSLVGDWWQQNNGKVFALRAADMITTRVGRRKCVAIL